MTGRPAAPCGSADRIFRLEVGVAASGQPLPGERFGHSWEERFALTQVYGPMLVNLIRTLLAKGGAAVADLAKVVIDAPNPRAIDEVRSFLADAPRWSRRNGGIAAMSPHA